MRTLRQRMTRWALATAAGLALTAASPSAATAADLLPTDAGVSPGAFTQSHNGSADSWGNQAQMTFYTHNYGPNNLMPGTWTFEYIAPGGTQFYPNDFANCQAIVALQDYRCWSGGEIFVDDPANTEGVCCNRGQVRLIIVSAITSPGRVKVGYAADTDNSNNSATIPAAAHPVTPPAGASPPAATTGPAHTPTPAASHPAPRASEATSAGTPTPTNSAVPTGLGDSGSAPAPSDTGTGLAAAPASQPALQLASGGSGAGPTVLWVVACAVLLAAGIAGAWLVRRRLQRSA